jgi:hypothetical protein
MVPLRELNQICSKRPVAHAIPAQIACRLLGNRLTPCQLDKICRPCEKTGVWLFYSAFLIGFILLFLTLFWVLRVTRLSRVLGWFSSLLLPPAKWVANCFAAAVNFYRNLPF